MGAADISGILWSLCSRSLILLRLTSEILFIDLSIENQMQNHNFSRPIRLNQCQVMSVYLLQQLGWHLRLFKSNSSYFAKKFYIPKPPAHHLKYLRICQYEIRLSSPCSVGYWSRESDYRWRPWCLLGPRWAMHQTWASHCLRKRSPEQPKRW